MSDQQAITGAKAGEEPVKLDGLPASAIAPAKPEGENKDLILGKFKNHDEVVKAYQNLEKKLGERQEAAPPAAKAPAETPPADLPAGFSIDKATTAKALEKVGIDLTPLEQEFATAGKLSEDSYKNLESKGISRATADKYIAGQVALQAQTFDAELKAVGLGKEEYGQLAKWAGANLTAEELADYNEAVTTGTPAIKRFAVQELQAKAKAVTGEAPKSMVHGGQPSTIGDVYESQYQYLKDIKNEQYKKDPAFRQKVIEKLSRSLKK